MYAAQLRSKDEILAIRAAEREYAKRVQLAQETLKVVREELATCYRENGVNHKMACKGLRDEYAKLIQDPTHGAGYPVGHCRHEWRYAMRLMFGRERDPAYRSVFCIISGLLQTRPEF
ncbi:unnamed protein product [Phytophthora fragariaefolia]|uniref:Unnamed protein product n=1 Tax=Phytophthora fragariaefolia TaxID=1490495 RepID=A0A9W6TSE5_9STRA|nr:unnamed protein product [Phytophthora fragariaefolia]